MTAKTLPDALAIESARGAEHLAQIRAEGWRAGAEAMRAAVLRLVETHGTDGRVTTYEVATLVIPEAPNG